MSNVIPLNLVEDYAVPVRDVPKAILSGLQAVGIKAEQAKVWRGGKFPHTLDLAIDIDCPWSHASRDGMTFAKVRLLVNPHRCTLAVQRDAELGNGCPHCSQAMIDRWLVTCRDHVLNGHPDHEVGWIAVEDFPDDVPDEEIVRILGAGVDFRADDSPMGHIFDAMERAEDESQARWVLAEPQQYAHALHDFREKNGWSTQGIDKDVARRVEWAKALLSSGTKRVGPTHVVIETVESVVEWLAEQGVASTLGVNAAWDRVKHLPDCPTQALVREAQAKRKVGG